MSRYEQFMAEQRAECELCRWLASFRPADRGLMFYAKGPLSLYALAPKPGWINR